MKNVLLISDVLEHYRIPLFESLCDEINLTVSHSNIENIETKFKRKYIKIYKKGPFIIYKDLPNFCDFDVVIFPFNLKCIQIFGILFSRKRQFKLGVFGIGVSASYNKTYDSDKLTTWLRKFIINKADFAIFYENYPLVKYSSMGIPQAKMSTAYNTIYNKNIYNLDEKKFESLIFIGTLYKQKRIFELLEAYETLYKNFKKGLPRLEIVGDGPEYNEIYNWIQKKDFQENIILHGRIVSEDQLIPIFNRAIACISPGQAGLSVQKCFSYGVPFITSYNAITGGESFSIIDGVTGFWYDGSVEGLNNVFYNLLNGTYDLKKISANCYNFYANFRNVDIWKNNFLKNIIN